MKSDVLPLNIMAKLADPGQAGQWMPLIKAKTTY